MLYNKRSHCSKSMYCDKDPVQLNRQTFFFFLMTMVGHAKAICFEEGGYYPPFCRREIRIQRCTDSEGSP